MTKLQVHFILFAIFFTTLVNEIETMYSTVMRGRSRSFGDMFHRRHASISIMEPLTEVSSSSSSLTSQGKANPLIDPQPSTSFAGEQISLKEIKLHETGEAAEVRNVLDVNLGDSFPSINIDPSRDGVFARLGKPAFRYGVAAAGGSAATLFGIEIQKYLKNKTSTEPQVCMHAETTEMPAETTGSTSSEENDDSDGSSSEENENSTEYENSTAKQATDCDGITNPI